MTEQKAVAGESLREMGDCDLRRDSRRIRVRELCDREFLRIDRKRIDPSGHMIVGLSF
jgi:hypothetical protein